MSPRRLQAAEQRTASPGIRRAVTRTLLLLADLFPEINGLPDNQVIALEVRIERALVEVLSPGVSKYGGPGDRSPTAHHGA